MTARMGCSPVRAAHRRPHTHSMSEIRANGVSLYEERGVEPILCIRSTGSSAASGRTRPRSWRRADARSCTTAADAFAAGGRSLRHDRAPAHRRCGGPARRARSDAGDRERAQLRPARSLDLALRYPDRVRALVLLEPADVGLPLNEPAARWMTEIEEQVLAAAEIDVSTVARH